MNKKTVIQIPKNYNYLQLTKAFVYREIKLRYASSILGAFWVLIQPLSLTITTSLVFSLIFHTEIQGIPYYLFAFLSMTSWSYFYSCINQSTRTLIFNNSLISGTRFPKTILIISTIIVKTIDYWINFILFLIILLISQYEIILTNIPIFLFILSFQILFQLSLSLLLSSLNVFYRDIQNILDLFLQLVFIISPVIYPISIIPEQYRSLFYLNPLTTFFESYRNIILYNNFTWTIIHSITFFCISILFLFSLKIFNHLEKNFADAI